jgi:hypothetical protein
MDDDSMTWNIGDIAAEVRANHAALKACKQHRFIWPADFTRRLGQKLQCANCGGKMNATDAGHYIDGWTAAGRDPNEVLPGWSDPPASVGTDQKKCDEMS